MSNENEVASEQTVNVATEETTSTTTEYGELIAESKKYRKRSQDAESRIAKLEAQISDAEKANLEEKEEYKTLYEQEKVKTEEYKPYKERHLEMVAKRKETILESFPEDKRESFRDKDLDVDVLEFMASEMTKPPDSPSIRNSIKSGNLPKDWTTLSPSELRENWGDILQDAINKNKKN